MMILRGYTKKIKFLLTPHKRTCRVDISLFFLFLISFVSLSCKENISPKGEFVEKYVLYSLINYDTTFQTAYLTRSYEVNGFDPMENKIDPAMEGAVIMLTVNDKDVYYFKEGVAMRTDTSRYQTPVKYYFIENYKPVSLDKIVISATLNNGIELKSTIQVPPISYIGFDVITVYSPDGYKNLEISWHNSNPKSAKASNIYYAPLFEIIYSKADKPNERIRIKVPLYFIQQKLTWMPIYPSVIASETIHYLRDSIIRILNSISEGDPQKENYIIHCCEFSLLIMDENLAILVAAENTFKEEFSMRLDVPDYSNIKNGLGVFGAFGRRMKYMRIAPLYIKSLGYQISY